MKSLILRLLTTSFFICGFSTIGHAQATRTWVSGVGDDANPCSRTAPCKTFAGAISKTAAGGEISVLDPGGFGGVTITKGMTLNGTGTLASILAVGQNGVLVNAGASDTVIIRDISINGAGSTVGNGIRFVAGGTLMVDHCWIYGVKGTGSNGRGIIVEESSDANVKVIDTVIENVGDDGIRLTTTAGVVTALVEKTRIMNCGQDGIESGSNVRLAVTNSQIFKVTVNGVSTTGSNSLVNLDDVLVAHCDAVGLRASAASEIHASDSIILNNPTGLLQNGGVIASFQGNSLIGNSVPGSFSPTTAKQ